MDRRSSSRSEPPPEDETGNGKWALEFAENFCTKNSSNIPNSNRIRFFFKNSKLRKSLESWTKVTARHEGMKNESVAAKHRAEGISLFIKADDAGKVPRLMKCLEDFNSALLHSSFSGKSDRIETSKLFANRSAVFFDLQRYDEALQDIEIALKLGYPFHQKVWIRKAKILLEQRKFKEALGTVEFIEGSFAIAEGEFWKIETVKKKALEGVENNTEDTDTGVDVRIGDMGRRRFNKRHFQENPTFQYASRRVRIGFDNERTRHVLAVEDIQPGDILFDEIPFASILLSNAYLDYCYHCHSYLQGQGIFPCKMCSKVKYCGETCSLQSWEEYHSVECQNLFLLQSVGLCHLAARIVMTAGLDQVLEAVADNLDNHPQLQDSISYFHSKSLEDGISEKRIQYLRIYSLAEHSDKMAPIDMFTYAKTAAGVTYWLQTHTTFFGDKTEEDIWAIGGAILRHTCQLISNAQQVYAFRRDSDGGIIDYERVPIGSAIYASTSLMNHSCDPNISTNYKFGQGQGRRLIVKATRQIGTGQEVLNSYGVTYQRHDFNSRMSSMSQQYFFTCKCTHCQRESGGPSFVEEFESMLCVSPSCLGPVYCPSEDEIQSTCCPSCLTPMDLSKKEFWLKKANELHEVGCELCFTKEGHEMLVQALGILEKQVVARHRSISEVHDSLAKSFCVMGRLRMAKPHLEKSLDYVTARFGTSSNEYGLELRKYAEILELLEIKVDSTGRNCDELMQLALSCLENYFPSTE